jgi:hypothetical protein
MEHVQGRAQPEGNMQQAQHDAVRYMEDAQGYPYDQRDVHASLSRSGQQSLYDAQIENVNGHYAQMMGYGYQSRSQGYRHEHHQHSQFDGHESDDDDDM